MLALIFFALAAPAVLLAFILGAALATRHHRGRLPQLVEKATRAGAAQVWRDLAAVAHERGDVDRELVATLEELAGDISTGKASPRPASLR